MTVKWENVTIPFTQGMDRSVDDYMASPGAVYTAQNLIVDDKNTLQSTKKFTLTSTVAESSRTSASRCVALADGQTALEWPHQSDAYPAQARSNGGSLIGYNERWGVYKEFSGGNCTLYDACTSAGGGVFYVCAWVDDVEPTESNDTYVELLVLVNSTLKPWYRTRVRLETNGARVLGMRICRPSTLDAWCYVIIRTESSFMAFGLTGTARTVSSVVTQASAAPLSVVSAQPMACFDAYENYAATGVLLVCAAGGATHTLGSYYITGSTPVFTAVTPVNGALPVNEEVHTNLSLRPFADGATWKYYVAFGVHNHKSLLVVYAGDGVTAGVDTTGLLGAPATGLAIASPDSTYIGRVSFDRTASSSLANNNLAVLLVEHSDVNFPSQCYVDAQYTAASSASMGHMTNTSALRYYTIQHTASVGLAVVTGPQTVHGHATIRNTPCQDPDGTYTVERVLSIGEHDAYSPSQIIQTYVDGSGGPSTVNLQPGSALGYSADYVKDVVAVPFYQRNGREPIPNMIYRGAGDYMVPHAPASDDVDPPLGTRQTPGRATTGRPELPYVPGRRFKLSRVTRGAVLGATQALGTTWLAGGMPKQMSMGSYGDLHIAPPILCDMTLDTDDMKELLLTGSGNYLFCATFLYCDGNGNYVESAPSPSFHTYNAGSNYNVQFKIRDSLSARIPGCRVRLYRTTSSDLTAFYLDNERDALEATATPIYPVVADTILTSGKRLYTQVGEVGNDPPPRCHDIIEHQNRLFCTDGTEIRLTKPLTPGTGPRWFPRSVRIEVPDTFGRAVKLISMDEKLLVFCEKKIGVVDGGGPTLDGLGATFSELSEVSFVGTPWDNGRSFVQTDDGVWWHSDRGLRLFTKGYAIAESEGTEVGRQVDEVVSTYAPIIGGFAVGGKVRWLLTGSYIRMITFSRGRFTLEYSTLNSPYGAPVGVAASDGVAYVWTPQRFLTYPETSTSTPDADITLDTGWLQLDDRMEGYQRVRKFMLGGQMRCRGTTASSGWTFTVTASYDYNEDSSAGVTEVNSVLVNPAVIENSTAWYRFRAEVPLSVQKCVALRLQISATPTGAARELRLTSMSLEVGRKRGMGKKLSSTERL